MQENVKCSCLQLVLRRTESTGNTSGVKGGAVTTVKGVRLCGRRKTKTYEFIIAISAVALPARGRCHASEDGALRVQSHFCVRHSKRLRVVPGHQRTSLSDLILVSYHLFSETHDHHFASAPPANPNKA